MDSDPWVIPLAAASCDDQRIGGKAAQLARLRRAGFRIAPGFCVTVAAYEQFLRDTQLQRVIQMELGRKPFEELRWEELWDAALRIRNRFSVAGVPLAVAQSVCRAVRALGTSTPLAVRSSAPGEDSAQRSFAGLHESFLYVVGEEAVLESIRLVWASLWSDAALLYRQELALDPLTSRMAVLIQEMRTEDRSGVAFGRDPRTDENDRAVIEAVPGPCSGLVDGSVDPDHWLMSRANRQVVTFRPGRRQGGEQAEPLLQQPDLESLLVVVDQVEGQLGWCPDVEWTGRADRLTVLQARPITGARQDPNDKRPWYLTLRPDKQRLRQLGQRVAEQLIPELRALGDRLAAEEVEGLDDVQLADCIEARQALLDHWKRVYWDEFIPFAHGVRYLGVYYNDAVHPQDPYEFVGLLRGENMLAAQRNRSLQALANQVRASPDLQKTLPQTVHERSAADVFDWEVWARQLSALSGGPQFLEAFRTLQRQFMDVAFGGLRLIDTPAPLLRNILELASPTGSAMARAASDDEASTSELEQRLYDAVGAERIWPSGERCLGLCGQPISGLQPGIPGLRRRRGLRAGAVLDARGLEMGRVLEGPASAVLDRFAGRLPLPDDGPDHRLALGLARRGELSGGQGLLQLAGEQDGQTDSAADRGRMVSAAGPARHPGPAVLADSTGQHQSGALGLVVSGEPFSIWRILRPYWQRVAVDRNADHGV
jgi:pyruvate,water dikinase